MIRILFTSVGRRVELMQAFKRASEKCGAELLLYGADLVDSAPALAFCDKQVIVPRISSPEYIPTLLDICRRENIDALIPTIDTDLMILAQNREAFMREGTKVIVSDPQKIAICRDKRETARFFKEVGLNTPMPVDDVKAYEGGYPAFIKPKDGSSSINAYKVYDGEELLRYTKQVPDYIIQPFVDGIEYTVDVFCDWNGQPIYITPRIRLAVRAGEVLKTEIRYDEAMIAEVKRLISHFKPCGAITVQLLKSKEDGSNWYIEINPRFGGGAPLSIKAGADSAEALLKLLRKEAMSYIPLAAEDGAVYSRFDQSVRIK